MEFLCCSLQIRIFFLAEFVGGSLAKRCRNQEGKLPFFGFHGKFPHFSVKIPRGVPYRIVVRNEEKTLGFCVFFIANSNIFWAELVRLQSEANIGIFHVVH